MNLRFAWWVSVVCHPLLMPTLLFGIIFAWQPDAVSNLTSFNERQTIDFFGIDFSFKTGLLMLIFFFTCLIPSYFIYFLFQLKLIKSIKLENLEDRRLPYLFTLLWFTFLSISAYRYFTALPELTVILSGICFAIGGVAVISLYWQISAHTTGIAGVVGGLLGVCLKHAGSTLLWPVLVVVVMVGLVTSARLALNAHTPAQVTAGIVLGLLVSGGTVYFYL